jgi:hypothetical protein
MTLPMMRTVAILALAAAACGDGTDEPTEPEQLEGEITYDFGPFTIAPNQEVNDSCIQITLHNETYVNVNVVELTTGPGFHHSNWFFVPDRDFAGPDGTFVCDDRGFDQALAAIKGGVFFAQSTQSPHEIQSFPPGVAVRIPPKHKLVAQIHLLNASDNPLQLSPNVKATYLKDKDVVTRLAGLSFQNAALALPPNMNSRFSVECDLTEAHVRAFGRNPDFKIYYALAHYHELGTGLSVEAVKTTGEKTTIYNTRASVGDSLGGRIDPVFDLTGYAKVRLTCDFYNPRAQVVGWGVGDQEMCVFLAFTDSTYHFGGGVLEEGAPQRPMMVGNTMTYENDCVIFSQDADRG